MTVRTLVPLLALALAGCTGAPAPKAEAPGGRAPAPAPSIGASLAGTRWIGVVAGNPDPRTLPRLEFVSSERVTGYTGCNMLTGSYTYDGDRLEVAAATTKRACIGAGSETEALMLAILAGRPRVAITGNKLILTTPEGKRLELDRN